MLLRFSGAVCPDKQACLPTRGATCTPLPDRPPKSHTAEGGSWRLPGPTGTLWEGVTHGLGARPVSPSHCGPASGHHVIHPCVLPGPSDRLGFREAREGSWGAQACSADLSRPVSSSPARGGSFRGVSMAPRMYLNYRGITLYITHLSNHGVYT